MEEQVKHMLAALQRQRNSANDRIVDLEVNVALKDTQVRSLHEELTNANETINRLRVLLEKSNSSLTEREKFLESLSKLEPNTFSVLESEGEYSVLTLDSATTKKKSKKAVEDESDWR